MTIIADRMTAEIEGDFVVSLIGMRINKWWMLWQWLPARDRRQSAKGRLARGEPIEP